MSSLKNCQVCHQQFSLKGPAPFLLPCLHSVCETCVTSAAGGVISCSTCQRDVNLTETRLQKDVITEKQTWHLSAQHHPELVLCTNEKDGNQAVCWCKECQDFLCEHCQMVHSSLRSTRKHNVQGIGKLRPETLDVDTYCFEHPKFILDIWDEQCCSLICRKCKDEEHAEHKSVTFDEAVDTARREVAELGGKVRALEIQQGAHLLTMDTDLKTSNDTCDNLTESISHTFNSLKTLIDQREKEMQIKVKQHQEKVRTEVNEKKKTSEACQKKCRTTSDYISKTLQYSSRHGIMSLRHILESKTGECVSSAQGIVYDSPALTRFNMVGLEKIKSVLAGFGSIQLNDDPAVVTPSSECGSQTEELMSTECDALKQELEQLQTNHEKKIQSLTETLTRMEKKTGWYRLTKDVSDAAYLLNCIHVEFDRSKYNAKYVNITTEGELINKAQTNPSFSDRRLTKYSGTSNTAPLPHCGSPQYFEVKTRLGIIKALELGNLLLEIGLSEEEGQDQRHMIGGSPKSKSVSIAYCQTHNYICIHVWRYGKKLHCLPETLENTPGTSATLHYGIVYDSVRGRISFLDVKNGIIIGRLHDVDRSVDLRPMFGVFNPSLATVSMSLVGLRDIVMTESKTQMILESLS